MIGVVTNVLSSYIAGLLTNRQSERNRAELVTLIEGEVKGNPALESEQAMGLAVRELDAIVGKDRDLTWQDDRLVIRPSGRIRKNLPSAREALDELVASVAARRRELGLPLTADEASAVPEAKPVGGALLPPEEEASATSKPDLRAEVLGLPAEVLREKERRRRESERD